MKTARRPERAVALMLAIFLTSFLFVLGLTMMYFIDQDARAGLTLQRGLQAQQAAYSGLLYARNIYMLDGVYGTSSLVVSPSAPVTTAANFYSLDPPADLHGFVIWKDTVLPIPNIHAKGIVRDASGRELSTRELASPASPDVSIMQNAWDVNL